MPGRAIFLTGLAGSGKTTVGKCLAKKLGWKFADTDHLVSRSAGTSIAEIFQKHGEAAFRRMESRALRSFKLIESVVVATGGGMPLRAGNRAWMKRHGVIVYLKVSPRRIASRLSQVERKKRPLLAGGFKALEKLAKDRAKYYEQAHMTVLGAERPDRVASRILIKIKGKMPRVLYDKTAR